MTAILSRPLPVFDTSQIGLRGAAGGLGEALAFLSGGVRPDPETLVRLCQSMRQLQSWLIQQAALAEGAAIIRAAEVGFAARHGGSHEPH